MKPCNAIAFGFERAETLACPLFRGTLPSRDSNEKGGPRDDEFLPALSPAWPRARPANAFAGLTSGLSRKTVPGLPFVAVRRCAIVALAAAPSFNAATDCDIRRWLPAGCRDRRQDPRTI